MPISKHNYLVKDVKDLANTVKEAFHIASSGRPGPVVIDIPKDVTINQCEFDYPKKVELKSYKPTYFGNPKQIKAAVDLISKSERPVIIAGGGVVLSNATKELRALIKNTNIPIATTLMAQGTIPDDNPVNLRMPGMHGTAYANYAIHEADLLIGIGMRFDDRITGKLSEFAKNAKVIHIDIDPAEIGKCVPVDIPIVGDVKNILTEINKTIKHKIKTDSPWLKKIEEYKNKHPLNFKESKTEIKPQAVVRTIAELTKGEAVIVTDVGENQMWASQFSCHMHPRHFITSGGLGTMGYGFPAAIGAKVGNPDKLVVLISGDGSFQMNLQELSTAAYYNIPVKIAILNNRYLGMVRQWQELFYNKRYSSTDLEGKQPDFIKLAESYDVMGIRIEKPRDIASALKKAFKHNGPVVMDFRVTREENVYPMVPAGGVLNKMILDDPIID
jgi:acetolactate synthase-1/2/3 large subunit